MKKILFILILLLSITGCNTKKEDIINPSVNSSEGVMKEQVISDFSLKPDYLIYEKGISTFALSISNPTEIDKNIKKITINYYLDNGTLVTSIIDNSTYKIEAQSSIYLTFESDLDLSTVTNIEYQISE